MVDRNPVSQDVSRLYDQVSDEAITMVALSRSCLQYLPDSKSVSIRQSHNCYLLIANATMIRLFGLGSSRLSDSLLRSLSGETSVSSELGNQALDELAQTRD